jgi:hypothetical protein
MAIADKTRKILWGRSGNRCAICRRELIIDATQTDDESIIGDECHILSAQPQGPRFSTATPPESLDEYNNLILLCRVHHKMVDDQHETYDVELLRQIKAKHEHWVASKLSEKEVNQPIRLRRVKGETPCHLVRLNSGKDLMRVLQSSYA